LLAGLGLLKKLQAGLADIFREGLDFGGKRCCQLANTKRWFYYFFLYSPAGSRQQAAPFSEEVELSEYFLVSSI